MVAVYRLPASLTFVGSCLGSSVPIQLVGLDGYVHLPGFAIRSDTEAYITPPTYNELPSQVKHYLLEKRDRVNSPFWGIVRSWNTFTREITHAEVSALLLCFEGVEGEDISYSSYLHGRGHPMGGAVERLFGSIEEWFERVRLWVRILVDQDVDEDVEAKQISMAGKNLEVLTVEGDAVSLPRYANSMWINMLEVEALNAARWRQVLDLASRNRSPPVEYSQARSARIQLRVHQYRRAVIDAASAVELTLTDLLHANIANLPAGIQRQLNEDKQTLGWLVDTLTNTRKLPPAVTTVSAQLPSGLKTGLVEVRNDVVHRHRTPTNGEAARAVAIAAKVLKVVKPLPHA